MMRTGVVENNLKFVEHSRKSLVNNLFRRNIHTKFRVVQFALLILDIIALVIAFELAFNIRFIAPTTSLFDLTGFRNPNFYLQFMLILIPIWIGLFFIFRLYDSTILFGGLREYANIFNGCTAGFMLVIVAGYLDPTLVLARAWLIIAWAFAV